MLSLLFKPLLKLTFPKIKLDDRLVYFLFIFFIQIEILILITRKYYVFYLLMFVLLYESISDYYNHKINSILNYLSIIIGIVISVYNNHF